LEIPFYKKPTKIKNSSKKNKNSFSLSVVIPHEIVEEYNLDNKKIYKFLVEIKEERK